MTRADLQSLDKHMSFDGGAYVDTYTRHTAPRRARARWRGCRLRALHPRAEVEASRTSRRPLGADHAVGVANGTRTINDRLPGRRRGTGRRGVVPLVQVLRISRGHPPDGATPVFFDIDPESTA